MGFVFRNKKNPLTGFRFFEVYDMEKEKKEPTAKQVAACKKLAHWLRHSCKCALPGNLDEYLIVQVNNPDGFEKWLNGKGVEHPQLGEAIANTIKAVEGK